MSQLIHPDALFNSLEHAGSWGPIVYIAVIAVSVVISQIPGAPLAIAAGALWHPLLAGLYTVLGGFTGALVAYGLGHKMGQPLVRAVTGKTLSFSADRGEAYLGWIIFTTRLFPIFSFDLISYGAGIAGLSLPVYASATLFGMIPSTLLLTCMGNRFEPAFHGGLFYGTAFGNGAIAACLVLFLAIFCGLPVLAQRHNWFNINAVITWE